MFSQTSRNGYLRVKPIEHKQACHATQIKQLIQSGKVVRDEH